MFCVKFSQEKQYVKTHTNYYLCGWHSNRTVSFEDVRWSVCIIFFFNQSYIWNKIRLPVDQARLRDLDPVLDHLKPGFRQNVKRKRQRKEENLQNIMMMVMMNIIDIKDRELHQEDHLIGKENDDRDRQYHHHHDRHHNRGRQVQIIQIMVQEFD